MVHVLLKHGLENFEHYWVSSNIDLEDMRGPGGGPQSWVGPGGCAGEAVSDVGLVISPQSTGFLCDVSSADADSSQEALCAWLSG